MRRIKSFDQLPSKLIDDLGLDTSQKDDYSWEDWEEKIISMIGNRSGFRSKTKRISDFYYHRTKMRFGGTTVVAISKQYIKDFPNTVCYPEPHGLYKTRIGIGVYLRPLMLFR